MDLLGKHVAIVGLARSGVAAAKLCSQAGALVSVSDAASKEALAPALEQLRGAVEAVETGQNSADFLAEADLIVVSPGVPLAIPALQEMRRRGIPIVAEVELASWFIQCPLVGITGTNGKTTTTEMCGAMLAASGREVFVGGNIGRALSELPLSMAKAQAAVVELSSFQLEAVEQFKPRAAALLNLSEDHLDRYPDFSAYADSKMRLLKQLGPEGLAVLNALDDETLKRCEAIKAKKLYFGDPKLRGAYAEEKRIVVNAGGEPTVFSLEHFAPVGRHNVENAMAAILLARHVGATTEGIQKTLDTFKPLPNRIELVRNINGVRIYNDSKATTPASVATALASFAAPMVLLMGGRSKGTDFGGLKGIIAEKTKAVFTFGEAGPAIADHLAGAAPVEFAGTMEDAMKKGFAACKTGDVLLLSPGCASFDAFRNYEHRGSRFRELAVEL